ncbi:hypothetical protein AB0C45_03395 [Streptomyces cyaneofuscatus]|uniref:hypothetical protein n=1 Tax=Streptomyces cyaneofuscatus TaxID=66883 RepID=UPI0033F08A4D
MADTHDAGRALSLREKFLALLRLRRDGDGFTPSARDISEATRDGSGPTLSHSQVNSLFNGSSGNPTAGTLGSVASALGAPAAFLLQGAEWDDLTALSVFVARPEAREVLRLMQGLEVQDILAIRSRLQEIRRQRGLSEDVPTIPPPPPGVDQPREGRPRRRSLHDAAGRAADYLEGR